MAEKLSPGAQQQLSQLEVYTPRVLHLHSLIEQFAVARTNVGNYNMAIKRAADALKLSFMTAGLEHLSQICTMIWMTAHRGGTQKARTRTFREHVGSLRFQMEYLAREIVRKDQEQRAKEGKEKLRKGS
jgi:hypothetical protein